MQGSNGSARATAGGKPGNAKKIFHPLLRQRMLFYYHC